MISNMYIQLLGNIDQGTNWNHEPVDSKIL